MTYKPSKKDEPLKFYPLLNMNVTGMEGSVTMLGSWKNAFGYKGVVVENVALELGITYATVLITGPSSFGFTGVIKLGDVVAAMAIKISTGGKGEQIFWGNVEELTPINLAKFYADLYAVEIDEKKKEAEKKALQQKALNALPDSLAINKLELYIAPKGGSIGKIIFEPGFGFECNMVIFDKKVKVKAKINDDGIIVKGEIDGFKIGFLEVKGKVGKNLLLDLELTKEKQSFLFDGCIILFNDIKAAAYIKINKEQIYFDFDMQFTELLTFKVEGKSIGDSKNPETLDFELRAKLENKIFDYLKDEMPKLLEEQKKRSIESINSAQKS